MSIYDININALDGSPIDLKTFQGKYILFVNVASECGFTNQYEGLQKLFDTYKDDLMVIGDCNQLDNKNQEIQNKLNRFVKKLWGHFLDD